MSGSPIPPIRLLLVDDHEIVREGLRTLLEQEEGIEVVGEAEDGEQAIRFVERPSPGRRPDGRAHARHGRHRGDTALLALALPSPPRVLVLTSVADEGAIREAIAAGALGYLMKDVSRRISCAPSATRRATARRSIRRRRRS